MQGLKFRNNDRGTKYHADHSSTSDSALNEDFDIKSRYYYYL